MNKIILIICFFAIVSCRKTPLTNFQSRGIITGIDARMCPCNDICPCSCGGYIFFFQDSVSIDRIVIDNPQIFKFSADVKFPINFMLNYENTSRCNAKAIKILNYQVY